MLGNLKLSNAVWELWGMPILTLTRMDLEPGKMPRILEDVHGSARSRATSRRTGLTTEKEAMVQPNAVVLQKRRRPSCKFQWGGEEYK